MDHARSETGVAVRIFDREDHQFYDSRVDFRLPSDALRQARDSRLADPKITYTLHRGVTRNKLPGIEIYQHSLDQKPKIDRQRDLIDALQAARTRSKTIYRAFDHTL